MKIFIFILGLVALGTFALSMYLIYDDEELKESAKTFSGLFKIVLGSTAFIMLFTSFIMSLIILL